MKVIDFFLEKITSYDIFNNLLPGTVFCYFVEKFTRLYFITGPTWQRIFIYYFVGVVLSRVGSLLVEQPLRDKKKIDFADYTSYVCSSQKDRTIQILVEKSNMYRTIIAMIVVFTFVLAIDWFCLDLYLRFPIFCKRIIILTILLLLIILFLFSYKKQTKYISERVAAQVRTREE